MATIPFVDTFDCQAPFPLDLRSVKLNIGQRDAIPINSRYDGMEVWVINDQKKYRLEGGTANENWVEVVSGGGNGELQSVTFNATQPTTQGNDGDIWFRPNDDTIELYYKVSGIWGMVGSWSNLELGETSDTAYRGDRGKIAYDHSQEQGNPHETQIGDIDGLEDAIEEVYEKAIVKDYINILDFNAVGDGVTESAQFIQDALDFAETNGIRRVYAPTGNYLLEKTVYIPTEIEFYGDGMDKTIFKIDEETILDTIGMFTGTTVRSNFYTPVISTKTTRIGSTLNNILLKDFAIDNIYYDDTGLVTQICPMLILNTKNSTLRNVDFGSVESEREQAGSLRESLGVSFAFAENILLDKCAHKYAGYEVVSVRFLSKNITTRQNVFNIDKPSNLARVLHAVQVARPTPLVTELDSEYGEVLCSGYTSDGDIFNLISNYGAAITVHAAKTIRIVNTNTYGIGSDEDSDRVFNLFNAADEVVISGNIINYIEQSLPVSESLFASSMIRISATSLNEIDAEVHNWTISDNVMNVELNRDVSLLTERQITPLVGNLTTKFHNAVITGNVVNITGDGIREQAVFGFYGTNIIANGNVVNFNGTVSQNMRAFVVEGGDTINVVNNTALGEHAYSLKINNVETLENLIIGANNFSSITLNNREAYTEVIAYKSDISSILIPINVFNQVNESSVSGNDGVNLLNPEYGLYILNSSDLQDGNSFLGELILHIDNQDKSTAKVVDLFGSEIYNNTNPSDEVIAKVNYKLDFFNPDGDDIDYKLSWQYVASGEVLFGEHTDTIDSTEPKLFELLVTGHEADVFTLKSAYLNRVTNFEERLLSSKAYKFGVEVKNAIYNNVELGNKIPQFNTIEAIEEFISNLKIAGVWSKLDIFSLFQMNDITLSDFALYDYKRGTFMTAFGGIGYTINGYEGNGIDGYINTNFNPATSGVNYTLNDASRGMYITSAPGSVSNASTTVDASSDTPESGDRNRTRIADSPTTRINNTEGLSSSINFKGVGLKVLNRDSSSNIRAYNNTNEYNVTAASTSINNATQLLLTSISGYSDVGFGLYFMGASLTQQEIIDLYNYYNTYLIRIGL